MSCANLQELGVGVDQQAVVEEEDCVVERSGRFCHFRLCESLGVVRDSWFPSFSFSAHL